MNAANKITEMDSAGGFFTSRTGSCLHGGFFGCLLFHLGKSLSERLLLQLLDEVLLLRLW